MLWLPSALGRNTVIPVPATFGYDGQKPSYKGSSHPDGFPAAKPGFHEWNLALNKTLHGAKDSATHAVPLPFC